MATERIRQLLVELNNELTNSKKDVAEELKEPLEKLHVSVVGAFKELPKAPETREKEPEKQEAETSKNSNKKGQQSRGARLGKEAAEAEAVVKHQEDYF